ncbi:hypothetical protein [Niabella aquatica]
MEHFFELSINYQGEERLFKTRLVTFGYTYNFYIIIDGKELAVECDDEQNYRAIVSDPFARQSIDPRLIKTIVEYLQKLNQ